MLTCPNSKNGLRHVEYSESELANIPEAVTRSIILSSAQVSPSTSHLHVLKEETASILATQIYCVMKGVARQNDYVYFHSSESINTTDNHHFESLL
jgi:hypothetical protein